MPTWETWLEELPKDRRASTLIIVVLVAGIIGTGCQLIGTLITTHKTHNTFTTSHVEKKLLAIADLHLFGAYNASLADLPSTQLQLTLVGTVVMMDDPNASRALIMSPGAATKVYRIGDIVSGNTALTRIENHYVVLNDAGTLQKLALPIKLLPTME